MMAACDTFRSGVVDQLRTHACRLQIPIFEKGYEKDPAIVAKEAIQEATRNGSDVVLSGSHAGIVHSFISYISISDHLNRMYFYIILRHSQDNEPLMRALSKLIYVNSPDLVRFIGEALVRQPYLLFWLYKILWDMCIVLTVDVVVIPNKGGVAIY
ncbi:putative signal-recognition-particle GTPase [Helianthus annuus]|nr:putative signal-recognition-particle GTPase [Helianthus annuus]